MSRPQLGLRGVHLYVAVIIAAGGALLYYAVNQDFSAVADSYVEFWMLVGFVALGELLPVNVSRVDGSGEITTSTIFTFAILLRFGTWPAVLAQVIASVAADLAQQKPLLKATFNASQYTIAVAAGGFALSLLTDAPIHGALPGFGAADLPGILLSATAFFLLNHFLTRVAIALDQKKPVLAFCSEGLAYHISTNGVLLALSPIAVVVAERSLVLVPLLALPMALVYTSATISAEKEYKSHQATHDGLTGLPNRTLFYERVEQAIESSRRGNRKAALMLIDLDRFKEVNDSLGHHIGDLLLEKIGVRLRDAMRKGDTVARMGGDEFAVVISDISGVEDAGHAAARFLESLERPIELEEVAQDLTLDVEGSIGVVICPDDGTDVDTLMQRADVAMYTAKEVHNGYEFYSTERDQNTPKQLALLGELRKAMEDDELILSFQPKVAMDTGLVTGVEALLRWHHPKRGLISPDEFIPQAERTGLIHALTRYTIEKSLDQLREWRAAGLHMNVAVNLSRPNLINLQFPTEIAQLLRDRGVPPSNLELEITESSVMADPLRARVVLAKLSDQGILLSLDDFGAGYSSLAHLKRMPVDQIKIDKSFVIGMLTNDNDRVIVRSIVDLGRNLGLSVVAEGVESAATWEALMAMGCDMAQGYWLGEPMAAGDVLQRIRELEVKALSFAQFARPPRI
jgi:diguanylate cyclase (GGDEF)-like protein